MSKKTVAFSHEDSPGETKPPADKPGSRTDNTPKVLAIILLVAGGLLLLMINRDRATSTGKPKGNAPLVTSSPPLIQSGIVDIVVGEWTKPIVCAQGGG